MKSLHPQLKMDVVLAKSTLKHSALVHKYVPTTKCVAGATTWRHIGPNATNPTAGAA